MDPVSSSERLSPSGIVSFPVELRDLFDDDFVRLAPGKPFTIVD